MLYRIVEREIPLQTDNLNVCHAWGIPNRIYTSVPVETDMTVRILFVCHGNICRSPMAEFVMKDLVAEEGLSDKIYIESCATSTEELGNDIYPPAKEELKRRGIPFEKRCARQMRKDDYDRFDLIVAMDSRNLRNLRPFCGSDPGTKVSMLMQHAGEFRDVEDPWYTGDFAKCFDDILEGCEALLSSIRAVMHDEL